MLLDRHADRIHAVCRRIIGNPEDALDATQEAMIAVARGIGRFDGRAAFTTWLYRVATNAALDELRRNGAAPVPVEPAGAGRLAGGARRGPRSTPASTSTPRSPRSPRSSGSRWCCATSCDLDYAEIAEVLDVPPGTVRSRIARGRAALAEALGNRGRPRTSDHRDA